MCPAAPMGESSSAALRRPARCSLSSTAPGALLCALCLHQFRRSRPRSANSPHAFSPPPCAHPPPQCAPKSIGWRGTNLVLLAHTRGQLDGGGNSQDRRSGCRADLPQGAVWTAGGRSVLPPHRRLERSGGAGATSAHSGARVAQTRAAGGRVSPEQSGCARSAPRGRESAVAAIRGAARTARSGPSGGYTLRSGCLSTVAVVSAGRVISGVGRDIRWPFLVVSRRDRGGDRLTVGLWCLHSAAAC